MRITISKNASTGPRTMFKVDGRMLCTNCVPEYVRNTAQRVSKVKDSCAKCETLTFTGNAPKSKRKGK